MSSLWAVPSRGGNTCRLRQGLARAGCCLQEAEMLMVVPELPEPFLPRRQGNSRDPRDCPWGASQPHSGTGWRIAFWKNHLPPYLSPGFQVGFLTNTLCGQVKHLGLPSRCNLTPIPPGPFPEAYLSLHLHLLPLSLLSPGRGLQTL